MSSDDWHLDYHGVPGLRPGRAGARQALARKDAALLTYVALNPGVASAQAAALLWPQAGGRGALNNLRQRLHRLRRATGGRLLEVAETARPAADLSLAPSPDTAALEADPAAWNDEILNGSEFDDAPEFAAWLAALRRAWADRRRDALAAIASRLENEGQIARALQYARQLLAGDPLSEHPHRRLMRLHYLRGDTAAAVAAFEACERTLKDELGLRPTSETLALLATIERGSLPTQPADVRPVPASLLRPPRAVGRERERAQLEQAHRDGCIVVLVGEAGMGKTRLLQDFVAVRSQAVYAQARPGDGAVPYGVLARLLRAVVATAPSVLERASRGDLVRIVPEFGPVAAGPEAPVSKLQMAIERLFVDVPAAHGLTLVVDDLHFADPASIEMLRALVDADALASVQWVFAHRPVAAADEDGPLLQSLADAPRARWVELAPLDDAALAELLVSLALPDIDPPSLVPALARHTGGNPLYVLETLRAMRASPEGSRAGPLLPRPEAIAHLIDRRLQRLSAQALTLGRVAALAGPDFDPALAEAVLGAPALQLAGAWAELEAADVLRGSAFAHDLVRDGMLRATPRPIARHAHAQIARFLGRQGAQAARVAAHWLAAGADAQAAAALREAAAQAQLLARPREQARLLLQAADAFERDGNAPAAMGARADAVYPLLSSTGPDAALAVSQALVEQVGRGAQAGTVWGKHAEVLLHAGRPADAEAAARRGLDLSNASDEEARLTCAAAAAQACGLQGRAEDGIALLRPWEERIEHAADPQHRIGFCAAYENLMIQADRPVESLPWTRKHLAFAEAAGNVLSQFMARMNLAAYSLRAGELDEGIAHAQRADALNPGDEQAQVLSRWNRNGLGYMLCGVGRFGEGLDILEAELAASAGTTGPLRALQEQWLADVMIVLGQLARAHRLLEGDAPPGMRPHKRLLVRAALARASGRDDAALLAQVLEAADRASTRFEWLHASIQLAQREDAAPARFDDLATQGRRRGYMPLALLAEQGRLQALLRGQRVDEALAGLAEFETMARRHRYPTLYFPDLLRTGAAVWAAAGRAEESRRCLTEAMYWVRSVALPNLPSVYRDGFLQRNRANLELQATFTRAMTASP